LDALEKPERISLEPGDPLVGDVEAKIAAFLEQQLLIEFGPDLDRSTDLFRAGVLDSYGYIEAVRFIESAFGITVPEDELLLGIEVSLMGLAHLAERKLAQRDE